MNSQDLSANIRANIEQHAYRLPVKSIPWADQRQPRQDNNQLRSRNYEEGHGPGRIHPRKFGSLYEILLACNSSKALETWELDGVGECSFL